MQKAEGLNINGIISRLYTRYKSLIRFGIVGLINTGVDFLAFTLAVEFLRWDEFLSQIAGYSMGIINSFILNKLWTFENKSTKFDTAGQMLKFTVVNAVSLGISLLGLKLIMEDYGVNIYISKLIVTGAAQIVNYMGYRVWVFGRK